MSTAFDLYTTRQVYLEGYKDGEAQQSEDMFAEIAAIVALLLLKLPYENLGDVPRRELNELIAEANRRIRKEFGDRFRLTMANLRAFAKADTKVLQTIFKLTDADEADKAADALWAKAMNEPIAGEGTHVEEALAAALAATLATIRKAILQGYAAKEEPRTVARQLVGTKASPSPLRKVQRQWRTAVQTGVQHIASILTFTLGSMVTDRYQWCSILDSRTTDICKSRNGRIYLFASGPRPPAHWNCRSYIVPLIESPAYEMPTYFDWVRAQPTDVQNQALGTRRGVALRKGTLKASDLPGFDYTRPLTVNQYGDRVNKLLKKVPLT